MNCVQGRQVISELLGGRADPNSITHSQNDANEASFSITQSNGKTCLSLSAERGHMNCVQELLRRTADLERVNHDGSTALMCAAHRAEVEACEYLLTRNSSVNHQDQDGWTPLMYSVNVLSSNNSGGEQGPTA